MRRFRLAAACLATAAVAVSGFAAPIVYNITLDGLSEAPPNASPGTGVGMIVADPVAHTLRVQVDFSGLLGNTTAAHIHSATAVPFMGTAGVATQLPSFVGFPLGVTAGSYDMTFDTTLASSWSANYINNNGGTPLSAEAALFSSLAAGTAYLNIHSSVFGGGEIRGFTPEPTSLALLGLGGLALLRRR